MAHISISSPATSSSTRVARAQGHAPLHHLRQRRRRQEHADRPPAVRVEDAVEDQLAALVADSRSSHAGRRSRLRAADGRADRRARAGITIDVAYRYFSTTAPLHRRRHAGPRAVHAQHGDRGLDGRRRRDPDRRPQRRADADAPAQLSRVAARHPEGGVAVNKLDMVGYSKDVFDRIEQEYRDFARQIGLADVVCIPLSALKGDNVTAGAPTRIGITGRR